MSEGEDLRFGSGKKYNPSVILSQKSVNNSTLCHMQSENLDVK
jgi:hypothetical protein